MSITRRGLLVAVLALLGIAVAAGITYATSQLVRQRIGLSSEPLTAGMRLVPAAAPVAAGAETAPDRRGDASTSTRSAPPARRPVPAPSPAAVAPSPAAPAAAPTTTQAVEPTPATSVPPTEVHTAAAGHDGEGTDSQGPQRSEEAAENAGRARHADD